jgi:hypothetical protein
MWRQAPSLAPVPIGPPRRQGGVVAELAEVPGEVADAGVGFLTPGAMPPVWSA